MWMRMFQCEQQTCYIAPERFGSATASCLQQRRIFGQALYCEVFIDAKPTFDSAEMPRYCRELSADDMRAFVVQML